MKHENLKRSWFAGFSDFFKMWKHGMGVDLLNLRLSQTLKQKKWKTQISRENGNQLEDLATFSHRGFQPPPKKKWIPAREVRNKTPNKNGEKSHQRFYVKALVMASFFFGGRFHERFGVWDAAAEKAGVFEHRLVQQYMDPRVEGGSLWRCLCFVGFKCIFDIFELRVSSTDKTFRKEDQCSKNMCICICQGSLLKHVQKPFMAQWPQVVSERSGPSTGVRSGETESIGGHGLGGHISPGPDAKISERW